MFIISKLFWIVAEPSNCFALLVILAAILLLTRWRRWGVRLAVVLAVAAAAIMVLPVGAWLEIPIEDRFPPPSPMPDHVDGIIVLGGAVSTVLTEIRGQPTVNEHAERFLALAELARRYPEAKLVYSGGSGLAFRPEYKEADAAKAVIDQLGIDPKRMIYERESRNTVENVRYSKALVQPKPGEVWLLVTSGWHMPRSVGIFRQQGWDVIPYPVDYLTDGVYWKIRDPDFGEGLGMLHRGLKEWIGMIAYHLLGYTDSWFPGPR
jgi:uncharacterized SAM-binding protein YcdF (DUF218 family)